MPIEGTECRYYGYGHAKCSCYIEDQKGYSDTTVTSTYFNIYVELEGLFHENDDTIMNLGRYGLEKLLKYELMNCKLYETHKFYFYKKEDRGEVRKIKKKLQRNKKII